MEQLNKNNIELVASSEVTQHDKQFVGTIHPHKGHKLFEINLKKETIDEAKFEEVPFIFSEDVDKQKKKRKLIINEDCIYISALNRKNAVKHLVKGTIGSKF